MSVVPRWARGPFEIILHAETHYRQGTDFDRRIAIVGYDNAIEVAITTYLNLHPIQRQNRNYKKDDVENWLRNFHSKLDFLECEASVRKVKMICEKADFVWYHKIRNDQYHIGGPAVPQSQELYEIREAALWVFGFLFEILEVESLVEKQVAPLTTEDVESRDATTDLVIDHLYDWVEVAGQPYSPSETLYAVDWDAYSNIGAQLDESRNLVEELHSRYPRSIDPNVKEVTFLHYGDAVFLKTIILGVQGKLDGTLEDTNFIIEDIFDDDQGNFVEILSFPPYKSPDENADHFLPNVESFDHSGICTFFSSRVSE